MPHKPSERLFLLIPRRWETSRAVPHSGSMPPPANWQPVRPEPFRRSRSRSNARRSSPPLPLSQFGRVSRLPHSGRSAMKEKTPKVRQAPPPRLQKDPLFVQQSPGRIFAPCLQQDSEQRCSAMALQVPCHSAFDFSFPLRTQRHPWATAFFSQTQVRYSVFGGMKEPNCPLTSSRLLHQKRSCRRE